jgi:hypothetical protein
MDLKSIIPSSASDLIPASLKGGSASPADAFGSAGLTQLAGYKGTGLLKACFLVHDDDWGKVSSQISGRPNVKDKAIFFQFNPATIDIERYGEVKQHEAQGAQVGSPEWVSGKIKLTIADVIFDSYNTKKDVREEYLNAFEQLTIYQTDLHRPPRILFVWGKLNPGDSKNQKITGFWYMTSMKVSYQMFLPDGTPVRANVHFELLSGDNFEAQLKATPKASPDFEKLYTIKSGDTLQSVSTKMYDSPREWRRIAEANNIDDPMNIPPGTKIFIPPVKR